MLGVDCTIVVLFCLFLSFFFFKQKTAYEMRISDWSSDVCSSDLFPAAGIAIPKGLPRLDGPDTRVAAVVALYNESRALFAPSGIEEIGRASCRERVCQYV